VIMAPHCETLYVVMCEDTSEAGMHPEVSAVFESHERADEYVARCQDNQSQLRYYIDTSFLNVFEAAAEAEATEEPSSEWGDYYDTLHEQPEWI